ncbi:MAG: hypothetical protein IKG47_07035 [Oscillospiraceae bacterium]|nr:hypothetical protein [Oscillospiraceae bacterium]
MFKRILALIFSLLVIAAPIYKASAVETPYKYTITVYAGNQGDFEGKPSYSIENVESGEYVTITWDKLSLKDSSRYYVRGFKLAGRDNDELLANPTFAVTEDRDYVISYGVRDEGMVNYSVKFLEEGTNKELASATQYEGRVGDKPIVSHKFIEGYLPNALNVTKTLTSNEADNVFTFYYHAVEYTNTVYETLYGPSGTGGGGGGGGGGTTPSGGETTPEGGETPTPTPAPSGGGEEMPPEIIDDDNPPLAPGGDDNTPGGNGGNSRILAYVAGAVGVAAVATGIILFARKKRDDDEDDEE